MMEIILVPCLATQYDMPEALASHNPYLASQKRRSMTIKGTKTPKRNLQLEVEQAGKRLIVLRLELRTFSVLD